MSYHQPTIRLNKYLAQQGITSRRKIDDFLKTENVTVNGQRVLEPGERINPEKDEIKISGKKVGEKPEFIYIALNKPKGVVSTVSDEFARKTVLDLVTTKERVYPVGRLDRDSSGLILLTNDGELTNRLTHPRFHVPRTYEVVVSGNLNEDKLRALRNGVTLKEGKTLPAEVKALRQNPKGGVLEIAINEGKNRQIRRMCGVLDLQVLALKRIAIGSVRLSDLEAGKTRELTLEEVEDLKKIK